jgi:hypothetical protein
MFKLLARAFALLVVAAIGVGVSGSPAFATSLNVKFVSHPLSTHCLDSDSSGDVSYQFCDGSSSQAWTELPPGGVNSRYQNVETGRCLTASFIPSATTCSSSLAQKFTYSAATRLLTNSLFGICVSRQKGTVEIAGTALANCSNGQGLYEPQWTKSQLP